MRIRLRSDQRFTRLLAATGLSAVGDGMVLIGLPLLAIQYTRSTILVAGVVGVGSLPGLLITLPSGVLVDRVNRRKLIVAVEVARFAVVAACAGLVAGGLAGLGMIYAFALSLGILSVLYDCTAGAALPSIVDGPRLVRANARLQSAEMAGEEMAGRAAGGIIFAVARTLPFVVDAVSFLASAILLRKAVPDNERAATTSSLRKDLVQGVQWYLRQPLLRLVSGLVAVLAFCQALVLGLLVLYATGDLHLDSAGYGIMLGISSIGNLVGAAAASRIHQRFGSAWCVAGGGLVAAATYPLLAVTGSPVVACAALALEPMAITVGVVASISLRQAAVPTGMQGRAGSVHMTVILGALPLGTVAGGLIASGIGIRSTMLFAGVFQIAIVVAFAPTLFKHVKEADHLRTDLTEAATIAGGSEQPVLVAAQQADRL